MSRTAAAETKMTGRQPKLWMARRRGDLRGECSYVAEEEAQAGEHGEAFGGEPVGGEFEEDEPADGGGPADDGSSGAGEGEVGGGTEEEGARGRLRRSRR